ncbi:MAG: HD domain-containing protein [Alphaproteobacteria bacterium]
MLDVFKLNNKNLLLSKDDFKKIISAYKINFTNQKTFNQNFNIENEKPKDDSHESLKEFLQTKLNQAFQNPQKLVNYQNALDTANPPSDRGIHDGFHTANVALYARNFLKIYQDNRQLFSEEMQAQIAEFDDPKKIRDLEILCLMHDVARINKDHDQDEYKNAFYVALILRNMGDQRFQGNEISEDGLKMIMDLATKESKEKDKSLMSKLIQGSDSLALCRIRKYKNSISNFNNSLNNIYKDFENINFQNVQIRKKMMSLWNIMLTEIVLIENCNTKPISLEFCPDPMGEFLDHDKIKKLNNVFLDYEKINSLSKTIDLPREKTGSLFVHVLTPLNINALGKCDPNKFICATMLMDGAVINHYAERGWINNPFLVLQANDAIQITSFKTDVGSNLLINSFRAWLPRFLGGFQSNAEMSDHVSNIPTNSKAFFRTSYYTNESFLKKTKEMVERRSDPTLDISSQKYWLRSPDGKNRIMGEVGLGRYGDSYSNPHHSISTLSNELRHNECHVLNSIHITDYVGISPNLFEFQIEPSNRFSDTARSGLNRVMIYKNQINAEKERLLRSYDPMQDENFKKCVEFELSRVTNLFDKIHLLQQKRKEIEEDPNSLYYQKSLEKKIRKATYNGLIYENSDANRQAWNRQKIEKINKNLVELFHNLREFEKTDNFGFKNLVQDLQEIQAGGCDLKTFGAKIDQWKANILDGSTNQDQLNFAINRVQEGLKKETKMALLDVCNPQELIILDNKILEEKIKQIDQKRLLIPNVNPESTPSADIGFVMPHTINQQNPLVISQNPKSPVFNHDSAGGVGFENPNPNLTRPIVSGPASASVVTQPPSLTNSMP